MNLNRASYLLLGLGALLIMSFLYIKTQAIDVDRHNQILDHINQFKQVDTVLNQHILEIRQGLLPFYDPTVSNVTRLIKLQGDIRDMLELLQLDNPERIRQDVQHLHQLLIEKQDLLEDFKSSNALRRNSLRYLPVATTQILAHIPPGDDLRQALNGLLLNALIYSATSDASLISTLNTSAEALRTRSTDYPPKLQQDLSILLAHVNILQENKLQTDELVRELLAMPLSTSMDKLLDDYIADHDRQMQTVNAYRLALYAFSVFLLACIGYILLRLQQSASALRRTVADLNYQKFAMDQHAIVSITDQAGVITYANQKFCDISKYTQDELLGKNHRIIKSDRHPPAYFKDMWRTISGGDVWHGQLCNRAKDGSLYWVNTTITPFMNERGKPYQYVAIRTDVSEIKQAEEKLRIQAAALETAANGILIADTKGNIQWVNQAFTRMTGYERNEAIGQTTSLLKSEKQGDAFYHHLWETITSGNTWHGELTNRRKDGSFYTEEQTISPVYNEQGDITHFIAIKQDISERLHTEEALRRSQKMEAIGQLSGGIAHDFNNRLGVIIGYLDFLRADMPENAKSRQWIDTATDATLRCIDLTRQLLTFSRHKTDKKSVVDIQQALRSMETMVARSVTPEVEIHYDLADDLWPVEINPDEFQDAILNLVINARDAMPTGGRLSFTARNINLDANYVTTNPGANEGEHLLLTLSDTGTGMDKATLERVFEPFFTTKSEGKGTGLGMAMVYGFVKRYGGHIKIDSEPGVGTTLHLYLPRATNAAISSGMPLPVEADLPTGDESILIVDDEADLLQLAMHYLHELGYHTYTAENAAQALTLLDNEPSIGLLFSDVVMPGDMDGYQLAQEAASRRPGLKVLLTSGFTSKAVNHNGLARFSAHLLNKPYRKGDLARRIRLVLDEEPQVTCTATRNPNAEVTSLTGCHVMVVDDEEDIRDLFTLNLERLGCTVKAVATGEEAVAYYQASRQTDTPVRITILDLSLVGGLDGKQTAAALHALNPKAKLIVASGHTEGPEMRDYRAHGFNAALEKTFNRENIKQVLEDVLSEN